MLDPISRRLVQNAGMIPSSAGRGPLLLMYHGTSQQQPNSTYSTTATNFIRHLELLKNLGWHTGTLQELIRDPESLPPKTVILTFDDGYANNFKGAFIPLVERNMKASWFIVSAKTGQHADWANESPEDSLLMNVTQLRELSEHGMEIGSHSRTHPDLTSIDPLQSRSEIGDSKKELEDMLGKEIQFFAYPYGRTNSDITGATEFAGYTGACSVTPGWYGAEPNPFMLRRVTIFNHDNVGTFARKLAFADNEVNWSKVGKYVLNRIIDRTS